MDSLAISSSSAKTNDAFKGLWLDMVHEMLVSLTDAFPECSGCSQCKTLFGSFVRNNEKLKNMIIESWAIEVTPYCGVLLNARKTTDERIHELLVDLRMADAAASSSSSSSDNEPRNTKEEGGPSSTATNAAAATSSSSASGAPLPLDLSIGKITRVLMFGSDVEKQSMLQKLTKPLTWLTMLDIETKWRDPLLTDESKEYLVQYLNKINGYALLHKIVPSSLVPIVMKYQGELVNRISKMPLGQDGAVDRVRLSNELVHTMFSGKILSGEDEADGEPGVVIPEMLSFITRNVKGLHLATECLSYPNCLGIIDSAALEQAGTQFAADGAEAASLDGGLSALASMLPPGVADMVAANADKVLSIDPQFLVNSMKDIIGDILCDDVSPEEKQKIDKVLAIITPTETQELIKLLISGNVSACMDHHLLKKMLATFHGSGLDFKSLLSKISIDKILNMVSLRGGGVGSDPMMSSMLNMVTVMLKSKTGGTGGTLGDISPEMIKSLASSVIMGAGGSGGSPGGMMGSAAATAMMSGMLGGGASDGRPVGPYGDEIHDVNFE